MRNFDRVCAFTVGRLLWRNTREILQSEKFSGRDIEWREGSGWIDRVFEIRGIAADVDAVNSRLQNYFIQNGEYSIPVSSQLTEGSP